MTIVPILGLMNAKINTFIFDCFGVICEPVLMGWYQENKVERGLVDENFLSKIKEFDLGHLSEDEMIEYFLKNEGVQLTKEKLREEIDSYLKIDRKLIHIIEELKKIGFKTVLLSNGNLSFFERKIYKLYPDFKNLFDEIVISSVVGMVKPNKEIYLHTLMKIDAQPYETLFIDDSKDNVDAAVKLGINGFVYTDVNSFMEYLKQLGIMYATLEK